MYKDKESRWEMAKSDVNFDKYANEIFSGKTQRQAYYIVYPHSRKWKPDTVDQKASTLFNSEKVQTRYRELLEANRDKSIIDRKELLRMAVKGLKIAIGEEYSSEEIINYSENGLGEEIEIKKKAKIKGTDLKSLKGLVEVIAKMEGFITDKVEHSGKLDINNSDMGKLTDDELRRLANGELEGKS